MHRNEEDEEGRKETVYEVLAEVNRNEEYACPIYVGKAVPDGARKGGQGDDVDPRTALFKRLTDHAKSVEAATNLNLADFHCRFLSVDDIWIPLTESLLIERFKPVWNRVLDGFGNHDPGKGRHSGKMPSVNRMYGYKKITEKSL